ncbi:MAG: HDOD domain-containing protein [Candidatus Latescibacterota bacterium]
MSGTPARDSGNPLIIIGDRIQPKPHLTALMQQLRAENALLDDERRIKYAVCADSTDVALALRRYLDAVRMILIGPGLRGNAVTVARMLSKKAHIVMVIDPLANPLGNDPIAFQKVQRNLEDLGIVVVMAKNANEGFFEPLVEEFVLSEASPAMELEAMTPEERAQMIDRRLDAVNKFPALPDTQRRVSALDDLDPPKKWAEAIDPDVTTRAVILKLLNTPRYGFQSRVVTIDQAVALASARTIREIVTACQIRQLFHQTQESTIDQYWRHSLAAGFYAKLFALPANSAAQTPQQKAEIKRFALEPEQAQALAEARLWERFTLEKKDEPFTTAMLHDIGKITMLMCLEGSLSLVMALIEAEAAEQAQQGKLWARSVTEVERFLMKDMDHQVIGRRLAERWELDPGVQQVIGGHHDLRDRSPDLVKLVALANLAASTVFPYPATDQHHPFPQLFVRIDKAIKKKAGMKLDEAVESAISEDVFEDLVDVLSRMAIPAVLWESIDFKSFFKLCYLLAPKIRSNAIAFLQQTA